MSVDVRDLSSLPNRPIVSVRFEHLALAMTPFMEAPNFYRIRRNESCLRVSSNNECWRKCHLSADFCHNRSNVMKTIRRSIGLLVPSPFEQLNLVGPSSVFSFTRKADSPAYEIHLLAATRESTLRSSTGLTIGPATHYAKFDGPIDTLLVIGGEGAMMPPDMELRTWLRERSKRARRIGSICTGAFLLAEAGLLDRRRAVTHWRYCDQLAEQYPRVRVERDPIFVKDGKMYTTAGVSAGIDLALALVQEDLGYDAVISISRELMLFPKRSGGQAQFSYALNEHNDVSNEALRNLRSWVVANLTSDLSVPTLAQMSSMSERTFVRRFGEEFHTTPAIWVQSLRVEAVRRHLENDNFSLKEIASMTGFRDVGSLRRTFRSHLRTSPAEYQDRFRRVTVNNENDSSSAGVKRNGTLG
jgi:transcriptional regulator GlxA family with amidase domain